jgi:hypothetical protein
LFSRSSPVGELCSVSLEDILWRSFLQVGSENRKTHGLLLNLDLGPLHVGLSSLLAEPKDLQTEHSLPVVLVLTSHTHTLPPYMSPQAKVLA